MSGFEIILLDSWPGILLVLHTIITAISLAVLLVARILFIRVRHAVVSALLETFVTGNGEGHENAD